MRRNTLEIAPLWRARTQREKLLLAAFAILAAMFVAWYGVASPLRRAAASAEADRNRASQQLAMTQTAVRELEQGILPLPASGIEGAVRASAASSGIVIERTRVETAGEITIWIEAIEPKAFFAWVRTLQKISGVVIVNLTAMRNEDGVLDVEARFAGGAK